MKNGQPKPQSGSESRLLTILSIAMVSLLAISLLAMLSIAKYDLPMGDDVIFGKPAQEALAGQRNIGMALSAAAGVVAEKYHSWQGTFSAIFLMALQPGVFGTSSYQVTPYLMLGALIASTLCLLYTLLCTVLRLSRRVWLIIGSAMLLFSIQLCVSPREAFYWYNGAVYYTLYYAFTLMFLTLIIRMFRTDRTGVRAACAVAGVVLAAVIAGGDYATVMIAGEAMVCALVYAAVQKRYRHLLLPLVIMLVVFAVGLFISMTAPGNAIRQSAVLAAGYQTSNALKAIALSIAFGAGFAVQWLDGAALALILFAALFIGPALRKTGWRFRYPLLVIVFTFLVFASQFTPSAYAASSPGPYRLRNVVYFSYLWMILFDTAYLTGWIQRKFGVNKAQNDVDHPGSALHILAAYPIAALACIALLMVAPMVKTLPPTSPSTVAVSELINGTAEDHAQHRLNQLAGVDKPDPDFVESRLLS